MKDKIKNEKKMKWPEWIMFIRHDVSSYNMLKTIKKKDKLYSEFLNEIKINPASEKAKTLAKIIANKYCLSVSDCNTPLADNGKIAKAVGKKLKNKFDTPDVIFVSPYLRTKETLKNITKNWPALKKVKVIEDERIREQEHGLVTIYNDRHVFDVLFPEQKKLYDKEGRYWYRFPQGENVPDVRLRNRSWLSSLVRDFSNKKILVVTHGLNIIATRANLERFGADDFIKIDKNDTPINCGVTLYKGNINKGKEGHLELKYYNKKLY